MEAEKRSRSSAARSALLWGAGSTVVRDVLQFVSMLVLVRLLSPKEYGIAAVAQALFGLLAIFSFTSFLQHALQIRNPECIDWRLHFTAGVITNGILFLVVIAVSLFLSLTDQYQPATIPMMVLAFGLLVEIPASVRMRYLECHHEWGRFRTLIILGTLLGISAGIVVASLGGGVLALVIQAPLFGVPAAIDLFCSRRPTVALHWDLAGYREAFRFGLNRLGSGIVQRGRIAVENQRISALYDFAAVGIFSRALGLGRLLVGRISELSVQSLYPIITRAESGSEQFRKTSGIVLQGVCWIAIPGGVFLFMMSKPIVLLIYGSKWSGVADLLPIVALMMTISAVAGTLGKLLLANNKARLTLINEISLGFGSILLAMFILPYGIELYLKSLVIVVAVSTLILFCSLMWTNGISGGCFVKAVLPPAFGAFIAYQAVQSIPEGANSGVEYLIAMLLLKGLAFVLVFLIVLRSTFRESLLSLMQCAPKSDALKKIFWL